MSECKFFIPGPTWVRPAILQEMTRPMIGHRSAEFRELFGGIRRDLKTLFETAGDALVITASAFRGLLRRTPSMQWKVMEALAERLPPEFS